MKLPKQWKHWCKKARLKPEWRPRCIWAWGSLEGRDRKWRIAEYTPEVYSFEASVDTLEEFDRWALTERITHSRVPSSEKEFLDFVLRVIVFS